MRIERMSDERVDECVDLFMDTFSREPWNDTYDSRAQVMDFFRNHMRSSCFLGYVLLDEGAVIALSVGAMKPWIRGMEYAIDEFCVKADWQKQGLGSAFLRLIEADIARLGINAMILCTERGFPSERFYRKNGFQPMESSVVLAKEI